MGYTKGIMEMVRRAAPSQTIMAGMELHTCDTVTAVFIGVPMLWGMYQLKKGVRDLAGQGKEASRKSGVSPTS